MNKTRHHVSLRKAASTSALVLASILFTGPARAQLATFDFAALGQAIAQYSAQASEYAEQAQRWAETVQQYQKQVAHYQQMIAKVARLDFSVQPTNTLTPITDISGMVAQACPGAGNSVTDTALSIVGLSSLDLNGNLAVRQRTICQQITLLQIDKYNETAKMLERMSQYSSLLQKIDQHRDLVQGISSVGDLQANTNEAVRNANKLAKEMSDWQALMAAKDAAIHALQAQQTTVAKVRLKGSPKTVLGEIVQAGAFAAAFN
ncbi:hypothetical protein QTI24_07630 [Variovorax sp. J22P240]|uniref:hypothetical protein n=1 Tax=Variovorax sp. J22P240 TaxID=3053514 RepID=UPI0025778524|nr:hypothetical protein [Variovorax sp. J22P240]MDL9998464.1 hypothetical protein [Variovorax sp. J22P240]